MNRGSGYGPPYVDTDWWGTHLVLLEQLLYRTAEGMLAQKSKGWEASRIRVMLALPPIRSTERSSRADSQPSPTTEPSEVRRGERQALKYIADLYGD